MYVKKRNVRSNVILFYICSPILTEDQEFHAISSLDLFRILTSEASESSRNFSGMVSERSGGYSRHILPLSSSIDLDMRVVLTAPLGFS